MEYIIINYKKKFYLNTNYNFTCFDIINENVDTNYFYNYLNSEIDYKLKNIWNNIIFHWNSLTQKKKFQCYQKEYKCIHVLITHEQINNLLLKFIEDDKFKALFCIKCINNNIF